MHVLRRWLFVVVVGALALPVMAQEPAEPQLVIPGLRANTIVESDLSEEVSARLFSFNGKEGDTVTLTMTAVNESVLDSFLVLLGPAGQVVAFNDDIRFSTLNAQIADAVLPVDGSYLVLATTFSGRQGTSSITEPQGFTLTFESSAEPAAADDTEIGLLGSNLTFGVPFNGTITLQEPVYYFFFNGEAGDVIDLTLTSEDFDTLIYLFSGSTGERIAVDDDGGEFFNSALLDFELPETGRYIVFATQYGYESISPESDELGDGRFTILVTKKR
ncbi:PPC domain-containing protein [Aggregatilineales bacterium SYSU G02658]